MLKIEQGLLNTRQLVALAILLSFSPGQQAQSQTARPKTAPPHKVVRTNPASKGPAAPSQASSAQITAYLQRLRGKLIQAWIIPDGNNHVTISGNFNQDGLSDNLKGSSAPRNENAEQAAMAAFNKCMPLETPPLGMNNGKVTVEFLSTADPHGDSKSSINLRLDPVAQPKGQASAPASGGQAAQPAEAAQSAPPAQSAQPAQPAEAAQSAQSAEAAQSAQSAPPVQAAQPAAQTTEPTFLQPAQVAQPAAQPAIQPAVATPATAEPAK
jgi:hypothetical protein